MSAQGLCFLLLCCSMDDDQAAGLRPLSPQLLQRLPGVFFEAAVQKDPCRWVTRQNLQALRAVVRVDDGSENVRGPQQDVPAVTHPSWRSNQKCHDQRVFHALTINNEAVPYNGQKRVLASQKMTRRWSFLTSSEGLRRPEGARKETGACRYVNGIPQCGSVKRIGPRISPRNPRSGVIPDRRCPPAERRGRPGCGWKDEAWRGYY